MKHAVTPVKDGEKREYLIDEIELGNFENESEIEKFFYKNIDDFMDTVFQEVVIRAETQKYKPVGFFFINKEQKIVKRGPRIDLYVECKSGNKYIIEFKNNINGANETIKAIGQILFYSTLFPEANRLVIVGTKYDNLFMETVKKFNLPIQYVLFGKNKTFLAKL